jgi:5-methyltetrahydropteroyltriglutamate--homocysteine methyltransferase
MLRTTIAGSLPKPSWLADPAYQLFAPWVVAPERRREAQHDAIRLALAEQEAAGLDIVTDGEQARRHYIWDFLDGLTGTETQRTVKKKTRGDRYAVPQDVARIVGEVSRPGPIMVDTLRFVKRHTGRPVKVALPGPMTIMDTTADEYYRDDEKTQAMRWAALVNAEARDLAAAGADVVQIDEPCFNVYLDKFEAWGVEALEAAIDGVPCTTAVHICYSYGIPLVLEWKQRNVEWGQYGVTLPRLARSRIGQVSVEFAASRIDPAVLAAAGDKDVAVGVIDVGTEDVESPAAVAERIRRVLPYVPPHRLVPSTDCGLVPRSRAAAYGKLRALAAGAALVRRELAAPAAR